MMQVSPGQPISLSDDTEVVMLVGSGQDTANLINHKEIHWGDVVMTRTIEAKPTSHATPGSGSSTNSAQISDSPRPLPKPILQVHNQGGFRFEVDVGEQKSSKQKSSGLSNSLPLHL